jgi:hypothetical protein
MGMCRLGMQGHPCQNIPNTQRPLLSLESNHQRLHYVPQADVLTYHFGHELYRPLFDQYTPVIKDLQQTGGLPYGTPYRDNTYSIRF